jgi:hypothetical protein
MTYTVLIIAYRKSGTSPAEFKAHYESTHAPLLKEIAGPLFPLTHTRHYLHRAEGDSPDAASNPATVLVGTQEGLDCDSYSLLLWENEEAFQKFFAALSQPEAAARIAADEEKFIDREKLKIVLVGDSCVTERT